MKPKGIVAVVLSVTIGIAVLTPIVGRLFLPSAAPMQEGVALALVELLKPMSGGLVAWLVMRDEKSQGGDGA